MLLSAAHGGCAAHAPPAAAPARRLRRGRHAPPRAAAGEGAPEPVVGQGAAGRQALFNNIAPVYDTLNDVLSLGQHRIWKARRRSPACRRNALHRPARRGADAPPLARAQEATVQWSGARAGQAVLDVCCGSGDIALRLASAVGASGHVTGLDFAAAQLAVAARREEPLLASGATSRAAVRWVEGDACALPFPDDAFDAATCGYGLRNVVDIPAALAQLRRVLRPGATAALLDFNNSESPLARPVQRAALDNLVVPLARAAGVAAEYEYLAPSIAAFPTGRQQVALARAAGFSRAVHYELAGGLMGVLVATK